MTQGLAYWEGAMAAAKDRERACPNPWSVRWLLDWYRGYDDYVERYIKQKKLL